MGFAAIIIIGSLLLALPFSAAPGTEIRYIDALFTSASAVCVTGLIVKDTPVDFSLFGQAVILLLIQIGGLGYMTSATALFLMVGKRIGLKDRVMIQEALNIHTLSGLVKFTKNIVKVTLLVEAVGAVVFALRFSQEHGIAQSLWLGIFHSISAFNNAGFSLFSQNLMHYSADITINATTMVLVITGGIGFLVLRDVLQYVRGRELRLSVYSKLVLTVSGALIALGTAYLLFFERGNENTIGAMPWTERILASAFHSVSARTAGFNTLDLSAMTHPSLLFLILLMYIGASSGSTGGGIKTGTFGVIAVSLWSVLRGKLDVTFFRRRLSQDVVLKAFLMASLAGLIIVTINLMLMVRERTEFIPLLFETVSAFGTVGLSMGDGGARSLSALFSDFGKGLIIITMFIGRLGPLTIGLATLKSHEIERIRYAETKILIG